MSVGLPTSTPAFQMATMYGVRPPDIPGFHYYSRERQSDIHFPRRGHAAARRDQGRARDAPVLMTVADRLEPTLAGGTPDGLRRDLEALLGPDRVLARVTDLVRYASDASPYRLIPQAVVLYPGECIT